MLLAKPNAIVSNASAAIQRPNVAIVVVVMRVVYCLGESWAVGVSQCRATRQRGQPRQAASGPENVPSPRVVIVARV